MPSALATIALAVTASVAFLPFAASSSADATRTPKPAPTAAPRRRDCFAGPYDLSAIPTTTIDWTVYFDGPAQSQGQYFSFVWTVNPCAVNDELPYDQPANESRYSGCRSGLIGQWNNDGPVMSGYGCFSTYYNVSGQPWTYADGVASTVLYVGPGPLQRNQQKSVNINIACGGEGEGEGAALQPATNYINSQGGYDTWWAWYEMNMTSTALCPKNVSGLKK